MQTSPVALNGASDSMKELAPDSMKEANPHPAKETPPVESTTPAVNREVLHADESIEPPNVGAPTRQWLNKNVVPSLLKAMRWLVHEK
jgi:hypothetical protein